MPIHGVQPNSCIDLMLGQVSPVDNPNQVGKASFPLRMIADGIPVGEDHIFEPTLFFDGVRQPVNEMDFTEHCVEVVKKSEKRTRLTFGGESCVINSGPETNVDRRPTKGDELNLFKDSDDWIFSSIFEKPAIFPELRGDPVHTRISGSTKPKAAKERGVIYTRTKRRADADIWTIAHPSVNKKVLRRFIVNGRAEDFVGVVEAYMPPNVGEEDQRYHVHYCEDGDEEDLDQAEYEEGRMRFKLAFIDNR
jgi:hypothetical protein